MSTRGQARVPTVPHEIPDDWTPSLRAVNENAVLKAMSDEELNKAVVEFRKYCKAHNLVRSQWVPCFMAFLRGGQDQKKAPKHKGAVTEV